MSILLFATTDSTLVSIKVKSVLSLADGCSLVHVARAFVCDALMKVMTEQRACGDVMSGCAGGQAGGPGSSRMCASKLPAHVLFQVAVHPLLYPALMSADIEMQGGEQAGPTCVVDVQTQNAQPPDAEVVLAWSDLTVTSTR
jgi:hypothetical protein